MSTGWICSRVRCLLLNFSGLLLGAEAWWGWLRGWQWTLRLDTARLVCRRSIAQFHIHGSILERRHWTSPQPCIHWSPRDTHRHTTIHPIIPSHLHLHLHLHRPLRPRRPGLVSRLIDERRHSASFCFAFQHQ